MKDQPNQASDVVNWPVNTVGLSQDGLLYLRLQRGALGIPKSLKQIIPFSVEDLVSEPRASAIPAVGEEKSKYLRRFCSVLIGICSDSFREDQSVETKNG